MSEIFISHSSQDSAVAVRVKERLAAEGHRSIFLDLDPADGIAGGQDWEQALYRGLRECRAVVALCSRHFTDSRWCFAEITHARSEGKLVIPLRIDDSEPLALLRDLQVIDARSEWEGAFERLMRGLRAAGLGPVGASRWDDARSPYPGLLAFEEHDAEVFFGRETEIQDGLEQLRRLRHLGSPRLLTLSGSSGSGKSSILRAGLAPRLRRSPDTWLVVGAFRPGDHPFRSLEQALASEADRAAGAAAAPLAPADPGCLLRLAHALREGRGRGEATVLLLIDQLEELLQSASDEASGFLAALRTALEAPDSPLMAVATLRSADLDRLERHRALEDLRFANLKIGPIRGDRLEAVIRGPARVAGVRIDAELVERMVRDAGGEEEGLPLLAFALGELWEQFGSKDRHLRLGDYRDGLGGLSGSITRAADGILATERLPAEDEAALRAAFVGMVALDDPQAPSRRRYRPGKLPPRVERLLERFVRARLLVPGEDGDGPTLELAHEALLRHWGRLAGWVEQEQEFLGWRATLGASRRAWEQSGRDASALLAGRRLERARREIAESRVSLDRDERDFVRRSQRRDRIRRVRVAGLAAVLASAAVWGGWEAYRAQTNRVNWLLDTTARVDDPLVASLLLAELPRWWREPPGGSAVARRVADSPVPLAVLRSPQGRLSDAALSADGLWAAASYPDGTARVWPADGRGAAVELRGHSGPVRTVRFSPEGWRLVTTSDDGTARLWTTGGSEPPRVLDGHAGAIRAAVFSPDGSRVATASADGTVRVWSTEAPGTPVVLRAGRPLASASFGPDGSRLAAGTEQGAVLVWAVDGTGPPRVLEAHTAEVVELEFSPDGRRLLTASLDGTARVWPLDAHAPATVLAPAGGEVWSASFSPDGSRVLTATNDGTARVWPLDGDAHPVELAGHDSRVWDASFSPDGRLVVTASADGTARLWRAADGEPLSLLGGHGAGIVRAVFGGRGDRLLTASDNGVVRVWPARGTGDPMLLGEHRGPVWSAVFSPDGSRVATGAEDGTTRVWRLDGSAAPLVLPPLRESVDLVRFTPDGTELVTASRDDTVRVWDAGHDSPPLVLGRHASTINDLDLSPDGSRALTASDDHTARVWRLDRGAPPVVLAGHADWVRAARFSPDGSRVVTASGDGTARVWSADGSGRPIVLRGHEDAVLGAAFSPDGSRVATTSADGTARVWPVGGDSEPLVLRGHRDAVLHVAFGPEGSQIVTASADGTARVWSAGGRELAVLGPHAGSVRRAAFSPDGTRIVTASDDGAVRVWRADGRGEPMVLQTGGTVWSAAFSPDGSRIVAASEDGFARVWSVQWRSLLRHLRGATSVCLPPEARMELLDEPRSRATKSFQACEQRFGRAPPALSREEG